MAKNKICEKKSGEAEDEQIKETKNRIKKN